MGINVSETTGKMAAAISRGRVNPKRFVQLFPICALLLVGGCSVIPSSITSTPTEEPAGDARYQPENGRDADFIARMRAAPPPAEPGVSDGKQVASDVSGMNGRGYVRIGTGHYALDDPAARNDAIEQGRVVGADNIFLYRVMAGLGDAVQTGTRSAIVSSTSAESPAYKSARSSAERRLPKPICALAI